MIDLPLNPGISIDDQEIEKMIKEFLNDQRPGSSLEIPNIGRIEYQAGRRLTYFKYRTGELRVWDLPDTRELSVINIIQDHLAKLLVSS